MPFAHEQKRMDIVAQLAGFVFHIDVTIVSPHLTQAARPAVVKAADSKVAKYARLSEAVGATFVPAAFDMLGNRCPQFDRFLTRVRGTSSVAHPHIDLPVVAVQSIVSIGLARAVGALLTARITQVGVPAFDEDEW